MTDCIFCKIIAGQIPAYKVYESDKVLAFLDINPVSTGHTLVIPKQHYKTIHDIPEDILVEIIKTTKQLAQKYKNILKADGFNILQSSGESANQEIEHYHMHVLPRYKTHKFNIWRDAKIHSKSDPVDMVHKLITEKQV